MEKEESSRGNNGNTPPPPSRVEISAFHLEEKY
jgi:hypothetical protein